MAAPDGAQDEGRNPGAAEINLFLFLDGIAVKSYRRATGEVRWALNAQDVCSLVELAFDLFRQWQPTGPLDAWNRTARLLDVPVLVQAPTTAAQARVASPCPAGGEG